MSCDKTHVSLFAGIGGIDIAAESAGFRTVIVCERDPHCRAVLAARFPGAVQSDDVRELTGDAVRGACGGEAPTLVSGGFPCQPFSSAGKRRGTSDDRFLWPEFCRIVRESRPRWVLGENVRGLLSIDDGRTFGSILGDLADLGYRVGWACYGADEAAGATHRRDRVFIVGYLADTVRDDRSGPDGETWRGRGILGTGDELADPGHSGGTGRVDPSRGQQSRGRGGITEFRSITRRTSGRRRTWRWRKGAEPERTRRRVGSSDGRPFAFPPGPADFDRWRVVLAARPDLAPALTRQEETESGLRRVADGVSGGVARLNLTRRQKLKMLGNAVVPAQVSPILAAIAAIEGGKA